MGYDDVVSMTSQALMMCVMLALPAVLVSSAVGLLVSFVQAITSLQDQSISQSLKLLAVIFTVFIAAPWAGSAMLNFTDSLLQAMFATP
jgi:type III secretion protein S